MRHTEFPTPATRLGTPIWRWERTLIVVLAILLAIGLPALRLGFGSHGDSRAIFEASVAAIANGHYAPSRSYGVPLYEYAAAALQPIGGIGLVNLYSLGMALAAVAIFANLLSQLEITAAPGARAWALAGFAFNPLLLINASSPGEWTQAMFFLVSALSCVTVWLRTRGTIPILGYGLCISGLVLSRPDFAVVCAALTVAVLWELRCERRACLAFIATTAAAGLTTATIFMLLNGGPAFFLKASEMVGGQIGIRRVLVASAGVADLFGVAGCLALAWAVGRFVVGRDRQTSLSFFEKLMVLTWPILFIRVAMLPDKLEYLFPLIPISLLALTTRRQTTLVTAVFAVSLILNSIFTVSVFDRRGSSDALNLAPKINKSAVMQDWDARSALNRALSPDFMAQVAVAVFGPEAPPRRFQFKNFDPGYTDDRGNLIISKDELYKLDNPRFTDTRYSRASYRQIFVCDQTLIADNVGWRVLQPPPAYAGFHVGRGDDQVRCKPEW